MDFRWCWSLYPLACGIASSSESTFLCLLSYMLRYLCILNELGAPLVEKRWSALYEWNGSSRDVIQEFWELIQEQPQRRSDAAGTLPWSERKGFREAGSRASGFFCYREVNGLWFLAGVDEYPPVSAREWLSAALVLDSLDRHLLPLLKECSRGHLSAQWLREHFVAVYELLEEMHPRGLPLVTEPSVLLQLVTFPSSLEQIMVNVAGALDTRLGLDRWTSMNHSISLRGAVASQVRSVPTERPGPTGIMASAASTLWQNLYRTTSSARRSLPRPFERVSGTHSDAVAIQSSASAAQRQSANTVAGHASVLDTRRGIAPQCEPRAPWRPTRVQHATEEFLVDIVETLSATVSGEQGTPVEWAVRGALECQSRLSGCPQLEMQLQCHQVGEREMAFHECALRPERNTSGSALTMSFIPPDGSFRLASYWLWRLIPHSGTHVAVNDSSSVFPLEVILRGGTQTSEQGCFIRVVASIKLHMLGSVTLEHLQLRVYLRMLTPTASARRGSSFRAPASHQLYSNIGSVSWDVSSLCLSWSIAKLDTVRVAHMESVLHADGVPFGESISVTHADLIFAPFAYSLSGLRIERLIIANEHQPAFKGMRHVLRCGVIQVLPGKLTDTDRSRRAS